MKTLIIESLASYILACVIANGSILEKFRIWFAGHTPYLRPYQNAKHFIYCRLCLSFWTSLAAVAAYSQEWTHLLPVYGLAYFAATQER